MQMQSENEAATAGIAAAVTPDRQGLVRIARRVAENYALLYGSVTADHVMFFCETVSPGFIEEIGPAAGAIFRGGNWEVVGYERSTRVGSHGHLIRRWKLKNINEVKK